MGHSVSHEKDLFLDLVCVRVFLSEMNLIRRAFGRDKSATWRQCCAEGKHVWHTYVLVALGWLGNAVFCVVLIRAVYSSVTDGHGDCVVVLQSSLASWLYQPLREPWTWGRLFSRSHLEVPSKQKFSPCEGCLWLFCYNGDSVLSCHEMLWIVCLCVSWRVDVAAIYRDSWVKEASEAPAVIQVLGDSGLKGDCDLGWKMGGKQSHV